jgi:energy-coupling factor transporter ATP-binding protein EcfA2
MALQKTIIKDFQSIHEAEIEHGGLTVLTGQSDLGKSAIIRAMRLLHRNSGALSDIRHGKSKLKVEQVFDDGNTISIEKAKTVNSYHVNDQTLAKIGRDVPEMVREILKTDELVLDKDLTCDLNFSGQFDPQFLLTESSTMVTKVISALSGIEIIYSAIREGNSQAQKLKAISQVLAGNISNLLKFEGLQSEVEGLQSELQGFTIEQEGVDNLSQNIEKLSVILQKSQILQSKVVDVVLEEEALKALVEEQNSIIKAQDTILVLESLKNGFDLVSKLDNFDVESLETVLVKLKSIYLVLSQDEMVYNDFVNKCEEISRLESNLVANSVHIGSLLQEETELKDLIKICDKCGRPL